jgi:tRNA nucleotidyltransferase (CCA-adding enzyme)
MNLKQILKEELKKISISQEELKQLNKEAENILKTLKNNKLSAYVGGSLAKGTLIKKDIQDIDIFVVFDSEEKIEKLSKILSREKIGFKIIHGSRDYFHVIKQNLIIELIPVLKTTKQVKNSTDLSLAHVNYIKNKIKKSKKLADEMKIAKAFCFAQNIYGAESYIKGFSGYSLELLMCYFGSFEKFLKNIEVKRVIDIEREYKNETEIKQELNESKLQSPIILIDPTYKYRNALSCLSEETFTRFLEIKNKFLKSPSIKFFERKEVSIDKLKLLAERNKAKFLQLELKSEKQEGDIAATKMKKLFDFICKELERKNQKLIAQEFVYKGGQEAHGFLVIRENKEIVIPGPPVKFMEAAKRFKKAHKKTFVKNNAHYAKEKITLDDIFSRIKQTEQEMQTSFDIQEN